MIDPVEAYFSQLRDIRNSGAGVAETSYYPPLRDLLSAVGHGLKPRVSAIINLRDTGGGIPDGGLFTATQLKGIESGENPLKGQLPARGAIEVKGTSDDAFAVAESDQVKRYVERYGLVLVTNLRDFVLVGRSPDGADIRQLETCRLAETEAGFWANVNTPRRYSDAAGEGLTEFLRRVLLHNAPLSDPKDLAWFLASYARTARLRLESRKELPALEALRAQLEDSLGLEFEGEKGDHFFRSTLVQTLFYGMFASWVLWARDMDHTVDIPWDRRFQWETASQTLHVPMVAELFYQFSNPGRLRDLRIDEVLEWAEEILWRVDRSTFFVRFREEHAVQYFYEPFLEAFDPELRKELGVWYTPDEVVQYMVARVDWALREELGIEDGLADPGVVVLDPCCGTGAFLVEVLRTIDGTLQAKGADALTRNDVKRAALERVIGFEIMPAPFVVAHLQLGILLAELGVPLKDANERVAVYLTNALTGWGNGTTPPKDKRVHPDQMHSTVLFPEFASERDEANRVKREEQILVVIGNPPYNSYANMAIGEERELSEAYRTTKKVSKPQGQGLNDLYVRFFRIAERQIVERTGRGVVCLISNYSWLDGLSFTGMRERFLEVFDDIWIDNLNGDKYRTGKLTPEGDQDPSIFSTGQNREGIQVGTAVATLIKGTSTQTSSVHYREFWGVTKLRELGETALVAGVHEPHMPEPALGLSFRPIRVTEGYLSWPRLPELFPVSFPGIKTSRDDFLVDIDRDRLEKRVRTYLDSAVGNDELASRWPCVMQVRQRFDAAETRRRLLEKGFVSEQVIRHSYRPFDVRWLYWEPETKLLDRPREEYVSRRAAGTASLVSQQKPRRAWSRPQVISDIGCLDLMDRGASVFPMLLASGDRQLELGGGPEHNLSPRAREYLKHLGGNAEDLFEHVVAVTHSPAYAAQNAGGLESDWPRLPLPNSHDLLKASASLGKLAANILDSSIDFTTNLEIGGLRSVAGESLDPSTDLGVTARWGMAGRGGITMPSTGRIKERNYSADESAGIEASTTARGLDPGMAIELLGDTCFDVYLNDVAFWGCVPARVWHYDIGGYQVIKKWLSYRETSILGRDLTAEEARYVTEMVRRIASLILLQPALDSNYERVEAAVWGWTD